MGCLLVADVVMIVLNALLVALYLFVGRVSVALGRLSARGRGRG